MRIRNLIVASIAALMTLMSCDQVTDLGLPSIKVDGDGTIAFEAAGGDQQVTLTATRDWIAEYDAEWLILSPEGGEASLDAQTVTVTAKANTGMDRSADIRFTIGMSSKTVTVTQKGPGGSTEALIVYANDFDKEKAEKTYGSGSSYPYLDQFDGWMNAKGTGAANVTYVYKGMSTRSNSTSNSDYSDYPGSGVNNLFFGANAYFAIKNIAVSDVAGFSLSFGTEKYDGNDKTAAFDPNEFHVYLSKDGSKWVELDYVFAGTAAGRWNVASADFSIPKGTTALSVCVKADKASVYRMDDFNLQVSETAGTAVDFANAVEMDFDAGNTSGGGENQQPDASAIYHNNFDKTAAEKKYGSGSSWPYLDQFDGWKNHAGSGAADVTYAYSGVSARNNSNSDGEYSDYAGSGVNNIFFGADAYFAVKNIALGGSTDLTLTFGTEKYSSDHGSVFTNSEYHIWLSNDGGTKWVEFTDYTFAGGKTSGRWNVATANMTVPSGTETLSICMAVDVASSYRLDDFKLAASETAGTSVDFTGAVAKDFSDGGSDDSGNDDGGNEPEGKPTSLTKVTVAEFIAAPVSTDVWYELTGEIISIAKQDYGNFTIKDATGEIYIYGMTDKWVGSNDKSFSKIGLKVGDTVTLGTLRGEYNKTPQGGGKDVPAFYISHVPGVGGGDEGDDEGGEDDGAYADATWAYTFAKGDLGENDAPASQVTLGEVTWKFDMVGSTYLGFDTDASYLRGIQMGKKADPASSITLSTEGISGTIKKIIVNTSGATGTDATLTVKVGDSTFGSPINTTRTATDYTFEGSASGKIELNWTLTTAAVYIKSIAIYAE